jgi:hypothetical protein
MPPTVAIGSFGTIQWPSLHRTHYCLTPMTMPHKEAENDWCLRNSIVVDFSPAYPNLYLNKDRVADRFTGYLGAIKEFSKSVGFNAGVDAKLKGVLFEAGLRGGGDSGIDVAWDMARRYGVSGPSVGSGIIRRVIVGVLVTVSRREIVP